mmetsp:Transcript_12624/g.24650  ORF Transcript_12624/g.24650 Transcript_12624/m.24650 type:complete len:95 (-) Transcript_12624:646-930(-)
MFSSLCFGIILLCRLQGLAKYSFQIFFIRLQQNPTSKSCITSPDEDELAPDKSHKSNEALWGAPKSFSFSNPEFPLQRGTHTPKSSKYGQLKFR